MRSFRLAIASLFLVVSCGKFDLGAGGQLDYARRWKDRYVCRPSSAAARAAIETCELRFLSGGAMIARLRDKAHPGQALEIFLTTKIETDRTFTATCDSTSGSLPKSSALREALPGAMTECRAGKTTRFEVKEKTLTARDEQGAFSFVEALSE